ncbi:moeb/ThiF domain-containing protein [Schizosaccharomyces cryophilus OY26]|uniref:Moeb/ThiF domain-containing protein n=1 Tax=Schizosaccharomyces cryophilus (strain OY26 / ATCC MYA-4695 / CBS 11777 / NBRC 106824 / NRRL Y48691) TaxID=653667 RepID=S9X149_SCHCR|nr:moeb/ThiF domain-containing protein [Schizosaccharomyces cryophilus OY26]EPY50812.1 moeb/ThiF domain-containing protein [Schizosaccharomyces cryophilus OY26]
MAGWKLPSWAMSKSFWIAVSSSVTTAAVILGTLESRKYRSIQHLQSMIVSDSGKSIQLSPSGIPIDYEENTDENQTEKDVKIPYDEELIREQLARNYAFFGEEGMANVRNAFVIVVGCGGVGSWATVMLARSGVQKIRIIDFDQVSLSSLNRHAIANLDDVGTPKTVALKRAIKRFAPWIEIEAYNTLYNPDSADELLSGNPSFVIDAIDNIQTKVDLLAYCYYHKIQVIASTGSACKSDPTRMNIADISATAEDPLSRATRRRLRLLGVMEGIPVAFSSEKPDPRKANLLPLSEEEFDKGDVDQLSALPEFRSRILPVIGPMPGIFGLTLATHVLTRIAKYPMDPISTQVRPRLYEEAVKRLHAEARNANVRLDKTFNASEMSYLIEEVYCGRSALFPHESQKVSVVRWNPHVPFEHTNLVAMTRDEARKHEATVLAPQLDPSAVYPKEVIDVVNKFLHRLRIWKMLY